MYKNYEIDNSLKRTIKTKTMLYKCGIFQPNDKGSISLEFVSLFSVSHLQIILMKAVPPL